MPESFPGWKRTPWSLGSGQKWIDQKSVGGPALCPRATSSAEKRRFNPARQGFSLACPSSKVVLVARYLGFTYLGTRRGCR